MENTILINEFLPALDGVDQGREWLELVNVSNKIIDLSGWKIQVGGVRYNTSFVFPEESEIKPEEYILICEEEIEDCDYYTNLLAMQNGLGKTDGVRILNSSEEIINTVLYSHPNRNELKNDLGEIAKEEDIIEMSPNNYSIARRNYSNTGHSEEDFFVTNSPTPGEKNIEEEEEEESNIIISEVFSNFIEFYTPIPPEDINQWYVKINDKKEYLDNDVKENFFILPGKFKKINIELYNPDGIKKDSFLRDRISSKYSYCRLNSNANDEFIPCTPTKATHNLKKEWSYVDLSEILKIRKDANYIVNVCIQYKYNEMYVISDESRAYIAKCNGCDVDSCYTSELKFSPNSKSNIYLIEESDLKNIEVQELNTNNYSQMFNQTVEVKGEYSSICNCIQKNFGDIVIENENLQDNFYYSIKGIFIQNKNENFTLKYPRVFKKEEISGKETLEDTGSPLFLSIFLLLFFTSLIGYCLFRKLQPFIQKQNFVRIPDIK